MLRARGNVGLWLHLVVCVLNVRTVRHLVTYAFIFDQLDFFGVFLEVSQHVVHHVVYLVLCRESREAAVRSVLEVDLKSRDTERESHEREDAEVECEGQERLAVLVGGARPMVHLAKNKIYIHYIYHEHYFSKT